MPKSDNITYIIYKLGNITVVESTFGKVPKKYLNNSKYTILYCDEKENN